MAAWDPFLDPADDGPGDILKVKVEVDSVGVLKDVPLDPWNDNTFVALAQEAAREAEERYEAAMKVLEAQQEVDRKERDDQKVQDARRLKLEQEAREIAKLSIQERRQKLLERQAYADMAMEAIGQSPAIAAMHRKSKGRDLDEPKEEEDLALGRAAAQIAAADMGVKINFKSKDEELPEARRLRESARQILGFDPLEGPGVLGFYELLRGPEGEMG